jgi:hypothetical protein
VARGAALVAAIAVALLAVLGAGGAGTQAPKRGGTLNVVVALEPVCLNPLVSPCGLPFGGVLEGAFRTRPDWSK